MRVRIAHRRHVHSSSAVRWVQRGAARPTIEAAGNGQKYRPSSESADRAFMRKTSPTAMTRQPCQEGSGGATVALARFADRDSVDADPEPVAADRLSGKRRDMFHERHAARQVATVSEEAR